MSCLVDKVWRPQKARYDTLHGSASTGGIVPDEHLGRGADEVLLVSQVSSGSRTVYGMAYIQLSGYAY